MLWVKAFHVVFVVAWFAGIFYLPRLFVYHSMCPPDDALGRERFRVMERKLYRGIMTPSAVLTVTFGLWLLWGYAWEAYARAPWLHAKLALVVGLIVYHLYCGHLVKRFRDDQNVHSHRFYRVLNELPVLILVAVVVLVIVKPWS